MRQNITIALLSVCATLLAVLVVTTVVKDSTPTPAYGQAVGNTGSAPYILATGMSTSGSQNMLYIFDTASQKLAAYTVQSRGIEYKGTRQVTWDLIPEELKPRGSLTPAQVRKATTKD